MNNNPNQRGGRRGRGRGRGYMRHDNYNFNSNSNFTPNHREYSNPTPNLHPSYYANSPRHSHPQWAQYTNYGQPPPIPSNFIVPHSYQGSLNHQIGYPCNNPLPNTQIQGGFHSNTVLAHQFHDDANWNLFHQSPEYANYYPYYMSPGIAHGYYQQPVQHFEAPLTPEIKETGHIIPTHYRGQNHRRQSGSQANYNNEIFAPRPRIHNSSPRQPHGSGNMNRTHSRPIQNRVHTNNPPEWIQFGSFNPSGWTQSGSLTDYNDELLSPHPMMDSSTRQILGFDDLPNWSHERTPHSYSKSVNNRSQNKKREYGEDQSSAWNEIHPFPDYIQSDSLDEQPCEVGQNCDICKADLSVHHQMDYDDRFHGYNFPETAVLPCQHAFHIICLELQIDSDAYLVEPPCPSCIPTSQTLTEY